MAGGPSRRSVLVAAQGGSGRKCNACGDLDGAR